jgi:hypothetical protein
MEGEGVVDRGLVAERGNDVDVIIFMIRIPAMDTAGSNGEAASLESNLQEVRRSLQSAPVLTVGDDLGSSPGHSLSQPPGLHGMIPAEDRALSFCSRRTAGAGKPHGEMVWRTSRCRSIIA